MKALRRILTAVLASILAFSCVPFGAVAEEDYGSVIDATLPEYYLRVGSYAEYGFFSEGELPSMAFIFKQIKLKNKGMFFGDYGISITENGYKDYFYEVPADVFEAEVFDLFSETDATLSVLRGMEEYMTDREEPYYRIDEDNFHLEVSSEYEIEYVGYRDREDGSLEAWLYVVGGVPENSTKYVTRYTKIDDHSTHTKYGGIGFRYGILRVRYAVRSIVDIKDGAVTIRSFEKTGSSDVPGNIKKYSVVDKIPMDGVYMHTTVDAFGVGTEVYCDNSKADRGLNGDAKDALEGVELIVSGYRFVAISGGKEINPKLPVTVEFILPAGMSTDVRVYKINEVIPEENGPEPNWNREWKYELVESTVNETDRTVSAVIDDFDCIYAIGGSGRPGSGDANYDGKINLADVAQILKHTAKWQGLKIDLGAADVTKDGRVNLADAARILKYVARWNDSWLDGIPE